MRIAYSAALLGVVGLLGAGVWLGCSSSDNGGGGGGGGGTDAGSHADTSVPTTDSGGGSDAGTDTGNPTTDSGGDAGPTPTCSVYCATILANCGTADGGVGGNAQYYDTADCMSTCALFAAGTYGETANSLGCRQYHATLAATDPTTHCPHAGAGGGAVCGDRCDDYCSLVMAHCATANGDLDPPYASNADCLAACAAYPYDMDASDYDPGAIGTLNCLDYHLRESLSDLTDQGIDGGHCDDLSIDGGAVRGACHQ